jgi:GNAT superfamily N-acetyltransferase
MFVSMGWDADALGDDWRRWQERAAAAVAHVGPDRAVFVVDRPDGTGLASCGAGTVAQRLPSPRHPDGRAGYVQWMSTEPAHQHQGYGRAVLRRLLDWYDELGVGPVELHATAEGARLYRSEGFWEGSGAVALRRRPWDPPPPASP